MLNNRQILPNRNCSTLAIPWCFYKISRAFDGISTSIIWQKYHPPELKHRPIFPLVYVKRSSVIFPCKWRTLEKCSHENPIAERTETRLLYLTQTGEHRVQLKKEPPGTAFPPETRQETPIFLRPSANPTTGSALVRGETERSEIQDLASPWDTIPIDAQDATYQRGAATTQREASIGVKRNTKHTKGTSKSNDTNPDLQTPTQPTQGHKCCELERQEEGRRRCHPHPRLAQLALTDGPYNPCNTTGGV